MQPWKLVGLPRAQWRRSLLLWLLLLLLTLASEVGSDTIKALFLNRIGSKALPPAFALEAALRLLATGVYFLLLRRRSYARVMSATTVLYAGTLLTMLFLLQTDDTVSLTLFFALEQMGFKLILLHWGVYIVDFFTVRESATAFPFVYSAQPLGSVIAGFILAWAPVEEMSWMLLVSLAALIGALLLYPTAHGARSESPRLRVHAPESDAPSPWRVAWGYVWRAPVVRYMALATVALVLVRSVAQVAGAYVLEQQFRTARGIGTFLGYYKVSSNVVVFALQALLSARLMRRFSPPRVNLSYSFLSLAAFGLLTALPGTASLVFSESVRNEWKSILKTPFSVMMYGTVADYARAPSRIAVFGVVVPLSAVLAALAMMAAQSAGVGGQYMSLAGLVLAVPFIGVTLLQNRAYKLALVDLLRDKLGMPATTHSTSTLLRIPDGRIFDIRHARQRLDYMFTRQRLGRQLFPDLYAPLPDDADSWTDDLLIERLDELLLLVELYRPKGAPHLRGLLVSSLTDRRVDLKDNAFEVISSILPPILAKRARRLLALGLERGVSPSR
jgi:hypothetical protein